MVPLFGLGYGAKGMYKRDLFMKIPGYLCVMAENNGSNLVMLTIAGTIHLSSFTYKRFLP